MARKRYRRDGAGNIINPPVIPEYEERLKKAYNEADSDAIAVIQDEYNAARENMVGPNKSTKRSKSK